MTSVNVLELISDSIVIWITAFFVVDALAFFAEKLSRKYPYLAQIRYKINYIIFIAGIGGYLVISEQWLRTFSLLILIFSAGYLVFSFPWYAKFYLTGRIMEVCFWLLTAIVFFVYNIYYEKILFYLFGVFSFTNAVFIFTTVILGLKFGRPGRKIEADKYEFYPLAGILSGGLIILLLFTQTITEIGLPIAFLIAALFSFMLFLNYVVKKVLNTDTETEIDGVSDNFSLQSEKIYSSDWKKHVEKFVFESDPSALACALLNLSNLEEWPTDKLRLALKPLVINVHPDVHYLFPLEKERVQKLNRDRRLQAVEECLQEIKFH